MKKLDRMVTRTQLRRFLKRELATLVARDERLYLAKHNNALTEYTFQAIIWDHICRFVGDSWIALVEDFIPGTNQKADIVLTKLKKAGTFDLRHGSIALEVKPNGQLRGLRKDLKKLTRYVNLLGSDVNFGVLVYLSPLDMHERKLRSRAKRISKRKLAVARVNIGERNAL